MSFKYEKDGEMMKEYKKLQIIKHALQHYIKRSNATDKDILTETKVLKEITSKVDELKDRYEIK